METSPLVEGISSAEFVAAAKNDYDPALKTFGKEQVMATRAERRQTTQNRVKAMTHQLRAEAFRLIADRGPMSPKQVAQELGVEVRDLNYHIKKLADFNCIEEVGARQVGSLIEHFYAATELHMIDTDEWDELYEDEPEMAEVIVDGVVQCVLDDYTTSRRAGVVGSDSEFYIVRTRHLLDPEGVKEALAASEGYENAMFEIAARSVARRSKVDGDDTPICASIVLFKMPNA